MNAKDAKRIGCQDGEKALREGNSFKDRTDFVEHGVYLSKRETRVIRTAALYAEGWMTAWVETEEPQAPVQHNPNTRFCECHTCLSCE